MSRQRFMGPYSWAMIVAGVLAVGYSAYHLPVARLDLPFLLLAVASVTVASYLYVRIPGVSGHINAADTFVFLTLLLYGGEAAVLLAAAEALCSSLRFTKRAININPRTVAFNAAMMAFSTFLTVLALRYFFGDIRGLPHGEFSATFILALCTMAFVQYIANSGFAALYTAFKTEQPILRTWNKHYLWASLTYFAGASIAFITAKIVDVAGFYAMLAMTPIIIIVFITYRTYLRNIEVAAAAAKAETAAAARAEAAALQAEQAQRHVEELNHYIAEQERIREQYSQIEKMSALGELASGVAHDFNNTLAGILGRAQILLGTKDPEKIEAGLKIIIKTARDGAKTVQRIQDFARQRRDYDFSPVAVDTLLLDVSEITRPRWKNSAEAANVHIGLELHLRSNAMVLGDESELREVLVNMVFNAVDAMPQGGKLTLSAEESGGSVVISIQDTGVGMSDEVRSRVFDPFFTTKGKAGMGLGLAVSYGIIRRHEGAVQVESQPGAGSTFRIVLPVAKGAAKTSTSGELPVQPTRPPSNQAKFLVVDDQDYMRDLLRDILEKEGCEVFLAGSGREALLMLGETKFAGVFTDLGMPGMSGWELAHAIRERDPRLPIAVITGWGAAVGSDEQQAAEVDWVVAKPFTVEQIARIAREAARRYEDYVARLSSHVAA